MLLLMRSGWLLLTCVALVGGASGCRNTPSPLPLPSPVAQRLTLSASPAFVLTSGSDIAIEAIMRSATDDAIVGVEVELAVDADAGTLAPRASVRTDASGRTATRLTADQAVTVRGSAGDLRASLLVPVVAPFRLEVQQTRTPARPMESTPIQARVHTVPGIVDTPSPRLTIDCAGGAPVATFLLERTCVFPAFGTYTVTGTAVTANGWTTSATTTVTVPIPAPEVVDIFFALVHSSASVSFSVRSVDDATRYHWTFDETDVDTTILSHVRYTFTPPSRERTITVRATDGDRTLATGSVSGIW